jgi:urease accessory protein
MLTAILQNAAGAIHGIDRLDQRIAVRAGAAAHVVAQGATSVHRADPGSITRETVRLTIEEGAVLEYLPGPRILFPDAAMETTLDIDCSPHGTAIIADAFTVHDPAGAGRGFRSYESALVLRRGDAEPVMVDRLRLDHREVRHFTRHRAYGTLVAVLPAGTGDHAELSLRLSARLTELPGLYAAASPLPFAAGIGIRLAAAELRTLRAAFDLAWRALRLELTGTAPARSLDQPTRS